MHLFHSVLITGAAMLNLELKVGHVALRSDGEEGRECIMKCDATHHEVTNGFIISTRCKKIHCKQEGLQVEIKQPENINASHSSGFAVADINVHLYTTEASTKSSNSRQSWTDNVTVTGVQTLKHHVILCTCNACAYTESYRENSNFVRM